MGLWIHCPMGTIQIPACHVQTWGTLMQNPHFYHHDMYTSVYYIILYFIIMLYDVV